MKSNAVKTEYGIEVYTNDIHRLADEYISNELDKAEDIYDVSAFTGMILYISDNIPKPDNGDIELLDSIFNIYIRLCCKYKILPTLECFGLLININSSTFSKWISGEYRTSVYYDSQGNYINNLLVWQSTHKGEEYRAEPSTIHSQTVKKWKDVCKNFLVNSLSNTRGTDANRIFIAKAAYGMAETAPIPTQNTVQHRTAEQIASDYGPQKALPGDVQPDF